MDSKRPTIDDVAKLAGVSIKTVSRVFNKEPNVRPSTRDKVKRAASDLNYRPNVSARRLATNRSYVIAMLYDNPNPDYVTEMQYGSLRVCQDQGYHLMIHPCDALSPALVDEAMSLYQQSTIDGYVLLQPISDIEELNRTLINNRVPFVRVSQRPFEGSPWISVGDEEAAQEMTEYLLDLGHRRIGFIMGHPDHGSSHDRLNGYRKALEARGLEIDESLIKRGRFDYESGYSCARRLLTARPRPTAIFASNDNMAMAALTAAHELDLRIPEDLSVAGFDDTSIARFAWPPLTTVRQPISEVAQVATQTLLQQLKEQAESIDQRLPAEIVCRASTGRIE